MILPYRVRGGEQFTGRLVDLHYFPHDRFEYGLIAGIIDSVVKGNIHTVVFSTFSSDIPTKTPLLYYDIIIQGVHYYWGKRIIW